VTDMRDELLERVVDELQTLPPVDEAAVRQIVSAAAADAAEVRRSKSAFRGGSWWQSRVPLAAAAGVALAAGLGGYAIRGGRSAAPMIASAPTAAGSLSLVSTHAPRTSNLAVPTQFVLDAARASRVALVGDFNGWNATATPLARVSSSSLWTVTIPLTPGRHTYAFMVNDTTLTLDPRAPAAQDPDFGTPSSVVLVGTP
jgi:hypothetical protein